MSATCPHACAYSQEHSTALHWAAGANASACVELLMEHGADATLQNEVARVRACSRQDGDTPVDIAQTKNYGALSALMREVRVCELCA